MPHIEKIASIVGNFTSPAAFMELMITMFVVLPISRKIEMNIIFEASSTTAISSENALKVYPDTSQLITAMEIETIIPILSVFITLLYAKS